MNVKLFLNEYFGSSNIESIDKDSNVWRCINIHRSTVPYQLIYVDFTSNWLRSDFSAYIESQILEDYYRYAGYLQWNFYYYFVSDLKDILANPNQVERVEYEDSYCRKSIVNNDKFISQFRSVPGVQSNDSRRDQAPDILTNWTNYLRENKLFFVFDDLKFPNYKQPTEDYINGMTFEDNEIATQMQNPDAVRPFADLQYLKLVNYRPFPTEREFEFAKVNLIHGQNAAGKTSLVEAIELAITGRTKSQNNSDYAISLKDVNGQNISFPANTQGIYKQRDIAWYKSGMTRGNNLQANFKRFNYYNSDAAFELRQSHDANEFNLETVIEDIALGSDVNKLETRIKEFSSRFNDKVSNYNVFLQRANDEIAEKNRAIDSLKSSTTDIASYRRLVIEQLFENQWNGDKQLPDNNDAVARLDSQLRYCLSSARQLEKMIHPITGLTLIKLKSESETTNERLSNIKIFKEKIRDEKDRIEKEEKRLEALSKADTAIKKLAPYFSTSNINELPGLEQRIKLISNQLDRAKEIDRILDNLPHAEMKSLDHQRDIEDLHSEAEKQFEIFDSDVKGIDSEISKLNDGLKQLEGIYNEIKTLGRQFYDLSDVKETCPLCNSHFHGDQLASAIHHVKESFGSDRLVTLKTNKAALVEVRGRKLKELEYIRSIKDFLTRNNNSLSSLNDIEAFINLNKKQITQLNDDLLNLTSTKFLFDLAGLSESEYEGLIKEYNENTGKNSANPFSYQEEYTSVSKDLISIEDTLSQSKNDLNELESELKDILAGSTELELMTDASALSGAVTTINAISQYFIIKGEDSLNEIQDRIERCISSLDSLRNVIKDSQGKSQGIQILQEQIKDKLVEVQDVTLKRNRAGFAFEKLNTLMQEHPKSAILTEYLRENKEQIVRAFAYIHSPNEFNDIIIGEEGVSLVAHDGSTRNLNEVSTGQRTALSLSIFLSLNLRLTSGPGLLIFDDPVTYVDDLNILSFIDYLREIVLKTNRQIIFITANEDIAFLFAKKFEFLTNEFRRIKLNRETATT